VPGIIIYGDTYCINATFLIGKIETTTQSY